MGRHRVLYAPRHARRTPHHPDAHAHRLGWPHHLTSAWPGPLDGGECLASPPAPRTPFTFHPQLTTEDALTRLAQRRTAQGRTLLLVPSRNAALKLHAALPESRLATRSKTPQHLREERDEQTRLVISTWNTFPQDGPPFDTLISGPVTLPVLSESLPLARRAEVVPAFDLAPRSSLRESVTVTHTLLEEGRHPEDDATHREYWDALSGVTAQDTVGLEASRVGLEYGETRGILRALLHGSVEVLVARLADPQTLARVRGGSFLPPGHPQSACLNRSSLERALDSGLVEETPAGTYIWLGDYDRAMAIR